MADLFGGILNSHDKKIKQLEKRANKIIGLEDKYKNLSDDELRLKTIEFKNRLQSGNTMDSILDEAFAVVREASFRVLGMKHYAVQIMGGIALHEGNVGEMKTGEGKTLVATLPAYLNGLTGKGVFVITVNDYLASRDREEMGQVHEFLGLSVGLIKRGMMPKDRKEAYSCDVIYGTNSEFGFDYLRDNMATVKEQVVQTRRNFAIIDEVDSILIDEARTPLIISGDSYRPSEYYITVDRFVKSLDKEDYEKDNEKRTINLSETGIDKAEKIFGLKNFADTNNTELIHHIRQSLYASHMFAKDKDYVIKDGEIVLVDRFTGRLMPGRTLSNGLHQAIEAKENVEISKENRTMGMITYQNYFKMFAKIAGMTGTAYTDRKELKSTYGVDVLCIPTNKPIKRVDNNDLVFVTKKAKLDAIFKEIEKRHAVGQPILIGTTYIDESEELSKLLKKKNIKHNILNAKQDEGEADIIGNAGQMGAITIATNMAGRGTDIKLGDGVADIGGLFVLGTERHDSRRIDNQLRGRSGRQGDLGESQFYISLEDSLFDKVKPEVMENIRKIVEKLGLKEDEAIQDKLVSQAIAGVQATVESMTYNIRKSTLEFDQILNKQRETIYNERNKILNGEDMSSFVKDILKDVINDLVQSHTSMSPYPEEWDLKGIQEYLNNQLYFDNKIKFDDLTEQEIENLDKNDIIEDILEEAYKNYEAKEEMMGSTQLRYIERLTLMKSIDEKWVDHLDTVEQMRQGINFQYVGGQSPVRIFNQEAFRMFDDMLSEVKSLTVKSLFVLTGLKTQMDKEEVIREEEKAAKIGELEDKYKINRKHLPRIPANQPKISLNIDINATQDVEADVILCYMDNGFEQKLEGHDKKIIINGVVKIELDKDENKDENKDWTIGWHQLKVIVSGQESMRIDFVVTEPEHIDDKNMFNDIRFFSNKLSNLNFEFKVPGCNEDKLSCSLMYSRDERTKMSFDVPVKDQAIKVKLPRPSNGWRDGFHELKLGLGENSVFPFVIVDSYDELEEKIDVHFDFEINEDEEALMHGQLINIDEKNVIDNIQMKINKSGTVKVTFEKKKDKWSKGRYEFRLFAMNKVILTKHFIID
ncbi:preprotein translocase subunit SecA [Tepidibacter hydrothermalis]|uniref:Protein translocase subunit SecA n=1 Tax=Tepidibacter hydrothermalis TaxID=3036126 RepID=A0ABY8EFI5_9FIRM|nr:preprotein translocase subunit SecA [Tepidibacter hydrothermalis]WFD10514.1 preprotein translocase subunit SecA [Tepidibacter hydrothermalis]